MRLPSRVWTAIENGSAERDRAKKQPSSAAASDGFKAFSISWMVFRRSTPKRRVKPRENNRAPDGPQPQYSSGRPEKNASRRRFSARASAPPKRNEKKFDIKGKDTLAPQPCKGLRILKNQGLLQMPKAKAVLPLGDSHRCGFRPCAASVFSKTSRV